MLRRRFLQSATLLPLGLGVACRRRPAPGKPDCVARARRAGPGRVLDAAQWETLRAVCACLIPSSEGEPGAEEANVVNYIDGQLATRHIGSFREEVLAGLRQLELLARRGGGSSFAGLARQEQDGLLKRLQQGMRLERQWSSRHWFLVVLTLALEGFLGHPVYGGNQGEAGWRFVGHHPRPPHPRCPYPTSAG